MTEAKSGDAPQPRRHQPQEPVALLLAGIGLPGEGDAPPRPGSGIESLFAALGAQEHAEPEGETTEPAASQHAAPHDSAAHDTAAHDAAAVSAPSPAQPQQRSEVDERLEALLMIADAPQTIAALAVALDRPKAVVRQAVQRLATDYDGLAGGPRRGFELRQVATGWRIFVRGDHDALVREFLRLDVPARLSQAALETLAVIAYRQPVSRGQVAAVRAVSVDSVMRTLQARGLVDEVGQDPVSGAILYGTTDALLEALGIRSIEELPPIAPLLQEAREVADHVH